MNAHPWTPNPTPARTKAIRLNNTGPIQSMREPSWLERLLEKVMP